MKKYLKAVTIGDINGIGIRLLIGLWKKNKIKKFVLVTNSELFKKYLKKNNITLPILQINDILKEKIHNKKFLIYNIKALNEISNTYNSILKAYELNKNGFCDSIITLPLNKSKIINKIDKNFIGQTELLQKLDKKIDSNMIFYSKKIIVTTLTTHIPLAQVNNYIKNKNKILKKIIGINNILKNDFKIKNPKIIISGFNPHSGENGLIGKEEEKYLIPTIKKLKKIMINISGPYSADTIFNKHNIKKYDCFICIYHDQALIPFKLISKFSGVNFTGLLDIVRTSPDHGPAYDLVKKENASDKSLINAFILADKINKNRISK